LAVGMRTIEDLEMRLKFNIEKNGELIHITRNKPKRSEELCNGGSLFWVINRRVLVRQKILNIKQIIGDNNKFFYQNPSCICFCLFMGLAECR